MKKSIIFLLTFALLPTPVSMARFVDSDIFPDWADEPIQYAAKEGVITGFGDGSFRPAKELNRAEVVTMILRSKHIDTTNVTPHNFFEDVPANMWYAKAITVASEKGWVKGKTKTTFEPSARINRAEFATIITRAFDLDTENFEKTLEFRDIPNNVWYSPSIKALNENNLIRNPRNLFFFPSKKVTRADAAWVFAKILTMPRLNGTSQKNDFSKNVKVDTRRTAIRPRNFNKFKQGYNIEQKKVRVNVQSNGDMIEMKKLSDFTDIGVLLIEDGLDEPIEIKSLHFKLRFNATNVGPSGNFIGKIIGIDHEFEKEIHIARTGELDVTGLSLPIEAGKTASFTLSLKPDTAMQYYSRSGKAHFTISRSQIFSFGTLKKDGSRRSVNTVSKSAPVLFESREFSQIDFTPTVITEE